MPAPSGEFRAPSYAPEHALLYDPRVEDVVLNRWRLQVLLQDFLAAQQKRDVSGLAGWGSALLAVLPSLMSDSFNEFLGLPARAWEVVFIGLGLLAVWQIGRILIMEIRLRHIEAVKVPSRPRDFVELLLDEMRSPSARATGDGEHAAGEG